MVQTIRLGDIDYDVSLLDEQGQKTLHLYLHVIQQLQDGTNMMALLTKARNAYISEIKYEIVKAKSGVDLGALLDD